MSEAIGKAATAGAADRLWRLWRQGDRPSLDQFLARIGELDVDELAKIVRVDQAERAAIGIAVSAEDYLRRHPAIANDPEAALDLIFNEYLLAERHGSTPETESFLRRFPDHSETLRMQIDLHRAMAAQTTGSFAHDPSAGPSAMDASTARLPERIGRYRILSLLGRGGMGSVYAAYDEELRRNVALKIPSFAPDDLASRHRFRREARIAASFKDPHLCPVYDVGEEGSVVYMTMPVLEGESLAARLKREHRLPPSEAIRLISIVARAVGVAHAAGVIHRDLKPANIMFDRNGEPVVMDFGLASRETVSEKALTAAGVFVGTPAYAAPEQVAAVAPATPACDVYAIGAILYECLTGSPPFVGEATEVLHRKLTEVPAPPSKQHSGLGQRFDAICQRALERAPGKRFPSTTEMAIALEQCREEPPVQQSCRRKSLAITAIAASVIVLAVLAMVVWPKRRPTQPAVEAPNVESIWIGTYSFDPKNPTSWKPALLWITERDESRFRGQAWTDDGDYLWEVEGTLEGSQIKWRYAKIIHEKSPTRSVENGANVEGQFEPQSIVVNYHDPGDGSRAVIRLRPAQRDEKVADDLATRAWKYNDSGKLDLVIQICNLAILLDDRSVNALLCRANALIKKSQVAKAIADLDQAIAINPKSHLAYADRAWAKTTAGDYEGALADAKQTIALEPDAAAGYYQRGTIQAAKMNHSEAIKDFTTAIEKKPDHAWAFHERGESHRAMGNEELAKKDFETARKLNPSLPKSDR